MSLTCCPACRERDLDEVLQATTVFSNVSKGLLAKHEDLQDVFGTDEEETICRKILAEGELQVNPEEVVHVAGIQAVQELR